MSSFRLYKLMLLVGIGCFQAIGTPSLYAQQSREQYIEKYRDLAIRQMHTYGIPASITLAQGCIESGNGNGRLARMANNHFGIKCHEWAGDRIYHDDDALQECFRKYPSAQDSYYDHSEFLRNRPRYQNLFTLPKDDYKGWAQGLQDAGYATNPQYATMLIDVIEKYRLFVYDSYPPLPDYPVDKPVHNTHEYRQLYEDVFVVTLDRKVRTTNGKRYILAQPGDTFASLAYEYNMFTKEIRRFNDATNLEEPAVGDRVYIQPKASKAAEGTAAHLVIQGESVHSLSQRYAIKEQALRKLNDIPSTTHSHAELPVGTKIQLR